MDYDRHNNAEPPRGRGRTIRQLCGVAALGATVSACDATVTGPDWVAEQSCALPATLMVHHEHHTPSLDDVREALVDAATRMTASIEGPTTETRLRESLLALSNADAVLTQDALCRMVREADAALAEAEEPGVHSPDLDGIRMVLTLAASAMTDRRY